MGPGQPWALETRAGSWEAVWAADLGPGRGPCFLLTSEQGQGCGRGHQEGPDWRPRSSGPVIQEAVPFEPGIVL